MRALEEQLIIPRHRRGRPLHNGPGPARFRLNRLHTFVIGAVVGGSLALFGGSDDPEQPAPPEKPAVEAREEVTSLPEAAPQPEPQPEARPRKREGVLQANQFIADVLASAGASAGEADRAVAALKGWFDFRTARPGQRYAIDVDDAGNILFFEYRASPTEIFQVARKDGALVGSKQEIEQMKEVVEVRGTIEHSLYDAFVKAGESELLAMSFADAFRFDVDFFHDTQKGDAFRVFVEKITNPDGEAIGYGRVLAAEYDGAIGAKRLYWFEDGYYDENGTASQRAFLKSPLSFTRVSSGFGYRHHPIHGSRHFHGGVDYAAPTGTPVHAIGDGVVTFAANKGASGNMITVRHAGGIESYYLHLSKLNVRSGQRVSQSTIIGKVGMTGSATGPHLDFRIKKNGSYLDPSRQVAPRMKSIAARAKPEFRETVARWRERFDAVAALSHTSYTGVADNFPGAAQPPRIQ